MNNTFRSFFNTTEFNGFEEFLSKEYNASLVVSPVDSYIIVEDDEHQYEMKVWIDLNNDRACECANIISYVELLRNTKDNLIANVDDYYEMELMVPVAKKHAGLFSKVKTVDEKVTFIRRRHEYQTYDTYLHDVLLTAYGY